jgi:ABC-type phosphate transport system substrate-binding protein
MVMKPMNMKMRFFVTSAIAVLAVCLLQQSWAEGHGGYKVVVNPSVALNSISRDELSRIFLKKISKFHDGHAASPVDLLAASSVRETFSRDVHGKPTSAVEAYWQQQVFSGREVPPPEKNEGAALDFVRSNSNGIAYVSPGADTEGLRVVSVTD